MNLDALENFYHIFLAYSPFVMNWLISCKALIKLSVHPQAKRKAYKYLKISVCL